MSVVAVAIVGGAVVGSVASSQASKTQAGAASDAADAQVQAERENTEFQKWLYEDQKVQQQPWVDVGLKALGSLQRYAGVDGSKMTPPKLVSTADIQAQNKLADEQNKFNSEQNIVDMEDRDYVKYAIKNSFSEEEATPSAVDWWTEQLNNYGGDRKRLQEGMVANTARYGRTINTDIVTRNPFTQEETEEDNIQKLKSRQNALMYEGAR